MPGRPDEESHGDVSLRGKRILVVDDDSDTAEMLSLLLQQDGHDVHVTKTLGDALEQSNARWDVVISDLGLPDGSGLELPRRWDRRHGRPQMIALSGFGTSQNVSESARAGFDEHLVKPLDLSRLRQLLKSG